MPSSLPLRRTALRLFSLALPVAALLATAPALHADSMTYDVTLSPSYGVVGGTGTVTLASAPSSSGTTVFSAEKGQLQNLSFAIGDQTFNLAGDPDAWVQFTNGQLTQVNFLQTVDHAPARYTLELFNGFEFYGNDFGHPESYGSFSAAPATLSQTPGRPLSAASSTPEPASLVLLATALLAGGFFLLRHKRAIES